MLRYALSLIFIVGMLVGAPRQEAWASSTIGPGALQPILEVLDKAKLSGSLEFTGWYEPGYPRYFPQFHSPAMSEGTPLQILRDMFADNLAVRVTQDSDGTIRMIENGVLADLLNVRISHISFDGYGSHTANEEAGEYTPNGALYVILQAPEVVAFMKARGIATPTGGGAVPGGVAPMTHRLPHISGSMDDLTLAEALDRVLKTFPGLWIYKSCARNDTKKRVIYIRFYQLQRIGSQVIVQ
jgi:hypothetical protein